MDGIDALWGVPMVVASACWLALVIMQVLTVIVYDNAERGLDHKIDETLREKLIVLVEVGKMLLIVCAFVLCAMGALLWFLWTEPRQNGWLVAIALVVLSIFAVLHWFWLRTARRPIHEAKCYRNVRRTPTASIPTISADD